jgi:site-specific DNA-methyltransferase (adenine-specific)
MSGQYRVILADPPWAFEKTVGQGAILPDRSARSAYPGGRYDAGRHYDGVLTIDQICGLPIGEMAAKDAILLMWTTMLHLPHAEHVMRAWGFRYRTCGFTWIKLYGNGKPVLGLGNYTRANAELCLLGLRGHPKRKANNVSQVIMSKRRQHSRKPDEQYDRIMRLFDGPYLELFARQRWPGWDVWGNQTDLFPAQTFLLPEHMLEVAS